MAQQLEGGNMGGKDLRKLGRGQRLNFILSYIVHFLYLIGLKNRYKHTQRQDDDPGIRHRMCYDDIRRGRHRLEGDEHKDDNR